MEELAECCENCAAWRRYDNDRGAGYGICCFSNDNVKRSERHCDDFCVKDWSPKK